MYKLHNHLTKQNKKLQSCIILKSKKQELNSELAKIRFILRVKDQFGHQTIKQGSIWPPNNKWSQFGLKTIKKSHIGQ